MASSSPRDQYLAAVSGFSIGAASAADAQIQMLTEYLTGELGGSDDQKLAAKVTRLVIAGDSLSASGENGDDDEEMRLVSHFFLKTMGLTCNYLAQSCERPSSIKTVDTPQSHIV